MSETKIFESKKYSDLLEFEVGKDLQRIILNRESIEALEDIALECHPHDAKTRIVTSSGRTYDVMIPYEKMKWIVWPYRRIEGH